MKKSNQTISLCMIVKDEEQFLPRCLESVKSVVDEMIIVDTGSSDRTVEIAQSYGAKVYRHPWEGNFSKHRNQSLSYATGNWIMIVDADEELDQETAPLIRKLTKDESASVIGFNTRSYLQEGSYCAEGTGPRLFRNGLNIHYKGYVHNQLIYPGKMKVCPVILWHYGYDLAPEKMKQKQQRSLALLRKQIAEFPDDISTHHHLAMTLLNNHNYEEAYKEALFVINTVKNKNIYDSYISWTYFVAASALFHMEQFDDAESVCLEALKLFDWSIDIHHILAITAFIKQNHPRVIEHGRKYFSLKEKLFQDISSFPFFQFETVGRGWVIDRIMGYAYIHLKQYNDGISHFVRAIENASKKESAVLAEEIGLNLIKLKKFDDAIRFLEQLPENSEKYTKSLFALANCYEEADRLSDAHLLYTRLETSFPQKAEFPFKKGLLFLKEKRYQKASLAFESAVMKKPGYIEAFINRGFALEKLGSLKEAEEQYRQALNLDPASEKAALNLGLLLFHQNMFAESRSFLERALKANPDNIFLALAFSKSCLEMKDIEALLSPCEKALVLLNMPSDMILETVSDIGNLFLDISKNLMQAGMHEAFLLAFEIALKLRSSNNHLIQSLFQHTLDSIGNAHAIHMLETMAATNPHNPLVQKLTETSICSLEQSLKDS